MEKDKLIAFASYLEDLKLRLESATNPRVECELFHDELCWIIEQVYAAQKG